MKTAVADQLTSLSIVESGPFFWIRGLQRVAHPDLVVELPVDMIVRGDDVVPFCSFDSLADLVAASLVDVVKDHEGILAALPALGVCTPTSKPRPLRRA